MVFISHFVKQLQILAF